MIMIQLSLCRFLVPGGYVPTLEIRDSRLNPKFDSRVHGKPLKFCTILEHLSLSKIFEVKQVVEKKYEILNCEK